MHNVIVMVDAVEKHYIPMLVWCYYYMLRHGKCPYNCHRNALSSFLVSIAVCQFSLLIHPCQKE